MSKVDELSNEILKALLSNFIDKQLSVDALTDGYIGPTVADLKQKLSATNSASMVDFDLALKGLENRGLVGTGPMVGYDNRPGSPVVVIGLYSKCEYTYLNENGYKAAQQVAAKKPHRVTTARVHISRSNFNQSPIGIGNEITQYVKNSEGDFDSLSRTLTDLGLPQDEIDSLQQAVTADRANGGKPSYEGETGNWFTRLVARAAKGGLTVGVDVVSSTVSKALTAYFGGSS
jgi:hypothetical protein